MRHGNKQNTTLLAADAVYLCKFSVLRNIYKKVHNFRTTKFRNFQIQFWFYSFRFN